MAVDFWKPGETIRLSPPWTQSGVWGGFSRLYQLAYANSSLDWQVTRISGSFGQPDLVVDIAAPANAINPLSDAYRVFKTFAHGDPSEDSNPAYSQKIPFLYNQLLLTNGPPSSIVEWENSVVSSIQEPDGLAFYIIKNGIADKELRCVIPTATTPCLWADTARNVLYCIADNRESPVDQARFVLLRSNDGARTFPEVSILPFGSSRYASGGASFGGNTYLMFPSSNDGVSWFARSQDGGVTWGEPYEMNLPGFGGQKFVLNPPLRSPEIIIFGVGTSSGSAALRSRDFGHTWSYIQQQAPPTNGTTTGRHTGWLAGPGKSLMVTSWASLLNQSAQRLWVSRSFDDGNAWKHTMLGDFNINILGKLKLALLPGNRVILTNGRDYQWVSTDFGQSWNSN